MTQSEKEARDALGKIVEILNQSLSIHELLPAVAHAKAIAELALVQLKPEPGAPVDVPQDILMTTIALLDSALICDPVAVTTLVMHRVPCNPQLADHPTIQVHADLDISRGHVYSVGLMGIVNGIVERLTGERVCVVVDTETDQVLRFGIWVDPCLHADQEKPKETP